MGKININFDGFENSTPYSRSVIDGIIRFISNLLEACSGVKPLKDVEILKSPFGHPRCSEFGDRHIIFINSSCAYWCQWAYQFAHEYCHHLIDGPLTGAIEGLKWFEETLCEEASIFALQHLSNWTGWEIINQRPYIHAVRSYTDNLLRENPGLKSELLTNRSLDPWMALLSEPKYYRDHYNAIACSIHTLFCTNPHLWQIIGHIGDSTRWQSLEALLSHLETEATEDYRHSVVAMRKILLCDS